MGASGQRKRPAQAEPRGERVDRRSSGAGFGAKWSLKRAAALGCGSRLMGEGEAHSMLGNVFTPKGFLTYGGAILLLLGLVGYVGIFSESSFPSFYLDSGENIAHTFLGIVALAIVFVP